MTTKKIKTSDILGDNYYIYELTSSNYTPALNGTITITCTMKDVYGAAASSKSITLYQNGTSKGSQTTNSSGVATWSITCSTAGLQKFNIKDTSIEVFVDNKSNTDHTHSNYVTTSDSRLSDARTPLSHAHGNLQNNGQVGSTAQANKNVVTNSSGLITTEDKPTIPSKTSQLTNDSGFLTSHQSLDSKTVTVEKLATAESGYLSSYAVKQNGVQVGNTINIPKDFLVKSGSVKTVSTANNPVSGYSVGDKYIDLVINVQEGTSTDSHIYILVSDLVDTPITISDVTNLQTTLNSKIDTAGTGLSKSGTTLNHSNNVTALTTAAFKKVKYDAQGHITGTSDVSASDLPTHTHSQYLTSHQDISGKENTSNKVTSISSSSTDTQYPSAKLVYDELENKLDCTYDFDVYSTDKWYVYDNPNYKPTINGTSITSNAVSHTMMVNEFTNSINYVLEFDVVSSSANRSSILFGGTSYTSRVYSYNIVTDIYNTKIEEIDDNDDATLLHTTSKNYFTTESAHWKIVRKGNTATLYIDNEKIYDFDMTGKSNRLGWWKWGSGSITVSDLKINHTHTSSEVIDIIDVIYPVGSIYMSVNSISPATLFGGTWEQIQDKFLLASGSTYSAGNTGGSADATLVSHQHGVSESGEYFVTSEASGANNTKVSYNASGNRYVDGMTNDTTPFHHRVGTGYVGTSATGKNMPPYLAVYVWKRTA